MNSKGALQRRPYYGSWLASYELPYALLVEAHYGAGERIPEHMHDSAYVCLVMRGGYTEHVGGTSQPCHEGMAIFHPAGERHSDEFDEATSARLFMIEPSSTWLRLRAEQGVQLERRVECRRGAVALIVRRAYDEAKRADQYSALVIEGLLLELAALIARTRSLRGASPPAWLLKVRERLRNEYAVPVSFQQLAAEEGVAASELAHSFRRFFGCTAGEDLRRVRIEAASRLLVHSRMPLAQVAFECGFASQSHFSSCFRRATGYTPRQYRSHA